MLKTVGNPSVRFGDQTINGGNLVVGTAGKGVDFSANSNLAGATSELLDWYEEGAWTPSFTNCGTASAVVARYTRIGRVVSIQLQMSATSITANSSWFTLPYESAVLTSGTFTRGTSEGGFVEAQTSSACYFATTPSGVAGTFNVNLTYTVA